MLAFVSCSRLISLYTRGGFIISGDAFDVIEKLSETSYWCLMWKSIFMSVHGKLNTRMRHGHMHMCVVLFLQTAGT